MFLSKKAIKEIKKELKEQDLFLSYKNQLKIKEISFLLTKVSIIFNSSIPLKKMYEIEESFINFTHGLSGTYLKIRCNTKVLKDILALLFISITVLSPCATSQSRLPHDRLRQFLWLFVQGIP